MAKLPSQAPGAACLRSSCVCLRAAFLPHHPRVHFWEGWLGGRGVGYCAENQLLHLTHARRRPASLGSQHSVAWLGSSFPSSSHAFSPSCKRQPVAPHHHQVTGMEILPIQQPCLHLTDRRGWEGRKKKAAKSCQHQSLLLLEVTFKVMLHLQ